MIRIGRFVKPIKKPIEELKFIIHLKKRDRRIWILYLILRYTAFRVSDIINLRVGDILNSNHALSIQEQKTRRFNKDARYVPLDDELIDALKEYCKDKLPLEPLFPSQKGYMQPISKHTAQKLLKKYGEEVGIESVGTHTGRKTACFEIWNNTHDIQEVKMYLGHDERTNTWVYLDIQEEFMDYINEKKGNPLKLLKELGNI